MPGTFRIVSVVILLAALPTLCFGQEDSCFTSGSVAGIVIATIVVTLVMGGLVIAAVWYLWRQKAAAENGKKPGSVFFGSDKSTPLDHPEKQLKNHQQNLTKESYAFDNPYFKDDEIDASKLKNNNPDTAEKGQAGFPTDNGDVKNSPNNKCNSKPKKNRPFSSIPFSNVFHQGSKKPRAMDDTYIPKHTERVEVPLRGHDFTGLGFNICGNMRDGIFVKDVLHRGPASESGKIKAGDKIVGVTVSFGGMVYEDALTILSYASPYDVRLELEKTSSEVDRVRHLALPASSPGSKARLASSSFRTGQRLFHPLYRSQSIDDLTQIGKDNNFHMNGIAASPGSKKAGLNSGPKRSQSIEASSGPKPRVQLATADNEAKGSRKSTSSCESVKKILPELQKSSAMTDPQSKIHDSPEIKSSRFRVENVVLEKRAPGVIILEKAVENEEPLAIKAKTIPAVEKNIHTVEKSISIAEKSITVIEKNIQYPIVEKSIPIVEKSISVAEKSISNVEKSIPIVEKSISIVEKTIPAVEKCIPISEKLKDSTEIVTTDEVLQLEKLEVFELTYPLSEEDKSTAVPQVPPRKSGGHGKRKAPAPPKSVTETSAIVHRNDEDGAVQHSFHLPDSDFEEKHQSFSIKDGKEEIINSSNSTYKEYEGKEAITKTTSEKSEEDEEANASPKRKASSLGDLTTLDEKGRKKCPVSSTILERAVSLDLQQSLPEENLVKQKMKLKTPTFEYPEDTSEEEHANSGEKDSPGHLKRWEGSWSKLQEGIIDSADADKGASGLWPNSMQTDFSVIANGHSKLTHSDDDDGPSLLEFESHFPSSIPITENSIRITSTPLKSVVDSFLKGDVDIDDIPYLGDQSGNNTNEIPVESITAMGIGNSSVNSKTTIPISLSIPIIKPNFSNYEKLPSPLYTKPPDVSTNSSEASEHLVTTNERQEIVQELPNHQMTYKPVFSADSAHKQVDSSDHSKTDISNVSTLSVLDIVNGNGLELSSSSYGQYRTASDESSLMSAVRSSLDSSILESTPEKEVVISVKKNSLPEISSIKVHSGAAGFAKTLIISTPIEGESISLNDDLDSPPPKLEQL